MIERKLKDLVDSRLYRGKTIIVVGPRQVGKTTLLRMISSEIGKRVLFWNCDEPDIRKELTEPTSTELAAKVANADIVFVDEAQRVKNIGLTLKLLVDNFPQKQFVVTGSSALELSNSISEPLTGRKYEYLMLPLSADELYEHNGTTDESRLLLILDP